METKFKVGQRVKHESHGYGDVISINGKVGLKMYVSDIVVSFDNGITMSFEDANNELKTLNLTQWQRNWLEASGFTPKHIEKIAELWSMPEPPTLFPIDRLRAELESIRARVPSDDDLSNEYPATIAEAGRHPVSDDEFLNNWLRRSGARWMRDRIFPPENKEK